MKPLHPLALAARLLWGVHRRAPRRRTPDHSTPRRRREDLVRPLARLCAALIVALAVQSYAALHNASEARTAAHAARDAASLAVANTTRIATIERNFCVRLQRVRDNTNRASAIIFIVLGAVSDNAQEARSGNAGEYHRLGQLPKFDPPTDVTRCLDPTFVQHPLQRFTRENLITLLPTRVVDAILHGR